MILSGKSSRQPESTAGGRFRFIISSSSLMKLVVSLHKMRKLWISYRRFERKEGRKDSFLMSGIF